MNATRAPREYLAIPKVDGHFLYILRIANGIVLNLPTFCIRAPFGVLTGAAHQFRIGAAFVADTSHSRHHRCNGTVLMNTGYLFYDQCARVVAKALIPLTLAVGSGFVASIGPVAAPTGPTPFRADILSVSGSRTSSSGGGVERLSEAVIAPSPVASFAPPPAETPRPFVLTRERRVPATPQPAPPKKLRPVQCEVLPNIQGTYGTSVVYCHSGR